MKTIFLFITLYIVFSSASKTSFKYQVAPVNPATSSAACKACEALVGLVKPYIEDLEPFVVNISIPICEFLNGTGRCDPTTPEGKWACQDLCKGMMSEEGAVIFALIAADLTPQAVCAAVDICPKPPTPPLIPEEPIVLSDLSNFAGEPKWANWPENGGNLTGTFVHISDLHIQTNYVVGYQTDCGQPICCRKEDGIADTSEHAAGIWGNLGCDMPHTTFESMMKNIANLPVKPDFLLNTGDDPAHNVWDQTTDGNLNSIEYVSNSQANIAKMSDRPVANIFGNHGSAPVNQYSYPSLEHELYGGAAATWSPWLSDDSKSTLKYGGFYQMRVAPKLRVVGLHSTTWSNDDFWFKVNATDWAAQIPWLVNVMDQIRARGEKCLLLRHHPMGGQDGGMYDVLYDITSKYSDIIVANFAGHAHTSFFKIMNNHTADGKVRPDPLTVEYVPGGDCGNGDLNPTFRVYHYNTTTYELLDYDQYWMDFEAANQQNATDPAWIKGLSARADFGLSDLSAASWQHLALSWLNGSDTMSSWQAYAVGMSRNKQPISNFNRLQQACSALQGKDKDLFPQCAKYYGYQDDHVHEQLPRGFKSGLLEMKLFRAWLKALNVPLKQTKQ